MTADRYPIRHCYVKRGVDWREEYKRWGKISTLVRAIVKRIISFSKVLIFVGEENGKNWKDLIDMEADDRWDMAGVSSGKH